MSRRPETARPCSRAWARPQCGRRRLHSVGTCSARAGPRHRRKPDVRMTPESEGYFTTRGPMCARGTVTGFDLRRGFAPTPCHDFNLTVRSAPRWSWILTCSAGARELGWGGAATSTGDLRAPRRNVHDRWHLGLGARATAASCLTRRDDPRGDADRRVRRSFRVGLRWRVSLRAVPPVRHTGRRSGIRGCRARRRPRRHSRRRVQPSRAVRQRAARIQPVVLRHTRPSGGQGFNLDGECSGPVRHFMRENVRHWLEEYRFDGLRFDATHALVDRSPTHIVHELADHGRASVAPRRIYLTAENEPQDTCWCVGGYGLWRGQPVE